jgi:thiamine kinase-like enzyme
MNLVNEIARKLAKLHSLNVPIKKNNYWIYDNFDRFYRESFEKFPIESMINSYKLMELMSTNLMREIEWIKKAIKTTKSPIVFCHNHFRGSNILIKQSESNNERILFCDFEYSSYGFRGIDFGSLFANWGRINVKHSGFCSTIEFF